MPIVNKKILTYIVILVIIFLMIYALNYFIGPGIEAIGKKSLSQLNNAT